MGLEEWRPISKASKVVHTPTFLQGAPFEADFMKAYEELRQGNPNFVLDARHGSNVFAVGLANKVFEDAGEQFRTAVPTDNIYGEKGIFSMVEGKHYTDLNALDVRSQKPRYAENQRLWKQANELVEAIQGRVPSKAFRIQGFSIIPSEKGDDHYNALILPAKNFQVIEDDRLVKGDYQFNKLDETTGIPVPVNNGRYRFYTRKDGVSRVCLFSVGDLGSNSVDLACSIDDGRVVVMDAEGIAQKFSPEKYKQEIQQAYQERVKKAEQIRSSAMSELDNL